MTDALPAVGDGDPRVLELDEFFSHPPERVWAALTEPALLGQWLMETDFRPQLGHRFTFRAPPNPRTGFSGEVACEVLEIEPCRRLRIGWDDARSATPLGWTVTWTLEPEGHGTRLFLEHAGFDPDDAQQQLARTIMGGGWRSGVLRRLAAMLAA